MAGINDTPGQRSSDELPADAASLLKRTEQPLRSDKPDSRTLRAWLAGLVLACVLPVWIGAAFLVYRGYQQQGRLMQQRVLETARALSLVVDGEFGVMEASLKSLATSQNLTTGDLAAFHRQAQAARGIYPGTEIFLVDDTGQQLVNTFVPYGTPLPKRPDLDNARRVFDTGKPYITNLLPGPLQRRPLAAVEVPVLRNGGVVYDLAMTVPVDRFSALLQRVVAPNWPVVLIDREGLVVARIPSGARFVGQPAVSGFSKLASEVPEGVMETRNLEGVSVVSLYKRGEVSGWTVAVGIPRAVLRAEIRQWLWWTVGGAILLSLLGIALALYLARHIAGSIQALIPAALALGTGEPVKMGQFDLAETREVGQSLVKASDLLQQRTAQLEKLNRTLKALNNSNQAQLRATDESALLQQVCRIVTEDCGYAMVWIGFAENDADKTVHPVASAGFEAGYLDKLRITWADNERGRGPTGTAIRTGQAATCRNMLTDPAFLPWRDEAIKRGYASSLVIPLKQGAEVFGAVTIYSRKPDAFSEGEIDLLTELADDLAHGIGTLRLRVAHARAEEELRHSERRFGSLAAATFEGIVITEGGRITDVNEQLALMLGCAPQEMLGREISSLLPPDERAGVLKNIDLGKESHVEHHLLCKDGRSVTVEAHGQTVTYEGRTVRFTAIRDITERKRAEIELRAREQRLRLATDAAQLGIFEWTVPTDTAVWENQRMYEIFGIPETTDPVNRDRFVRETLHLEDLPRFSQELKESMQPGALFQGAYRIRRVNDGQWRWIQYFSKFELTPDGKALRLLGVLEDITERKNTEQALLRSEKLASVGRMAATISHEINNPLEAVTNLLFLAERANDIESVRQYLQMADGELKRIAHITRQSLGFYRETNAPVLTSINALLESTVDLLDTKIRRKRAVIERQWDGEVKVTAVAGELRQVFSNLVSNSLDAIDERGTIKLRVSSGAALKHGHCYVRVTVADNGKGISADSRQHIFEPFFTTKGATGTGLGLWVSKQIIAKHGGTIRVRSSTSEARRGTAFSVILPVESAATTLGRSAGV